MLGVNVVSETAQESQERRDRSIGQLLCGLDFTRNVVTGSTREL